MICLMHDSEQRGKMILNGRPMTDEQIARSLGLDNQILTTSLTTLLTSGVATRCTDTGAVCSKRMVDDEKLRQIRTKAGKMGGNPVLLNQNPTTQVNQKSTPSYASASASAVLVKKEKDIRIPENEDEAVRFMTVACGVPESAIRDIYLEARGVGMVDWNEKPILDWDAYCRHKFTRDQKKEVKNYGNNHKNGRPSPSTHGNRNAGTLNEGREAMYDYNAIKKSRMVRDAGRDKARDESSGNPISG